MAPPPLHVLTETEKNELLLAQHEMIERMAARISELEALVGKPRKTSKNSHILPSKDDFGKGGGMPKGGERTSREGKHRPLTETPDKVKRVMATACCHCGTDVSGQAQRCRHRYDHIDLPPIRPVVTRVELFGLVISEGAIANAFRRMGTGMASATKAITNKLLRARIIASDETTTRTNQRHHPLAVGVPLGQGRLAQDRPAPGAPCRRGGAAQTDQGMARQVLRLPHQP
jgi:hypothetical protein